MSEINLFVKYSNYDKMPKIVDVEFIDLARFDKLLVVCAREGQKIRLSKLKDQKLHDATVVGVWDLAGQPFSTLTEYDAVYILDPERIGYPKLKSQWKRIIDTWCGQ
jgi:hypothetical protein